MWDVRKESRDLMEENRLGGDVVGVGLCWRRVKVGG